MVFAFDLHKQWPSEAATARERDKMAGKIAIKRLSVSDCRLFGDIFQRSGGSGQKGINLNGDVMTGQLYPNLSATAALNDNRIPLPISIFGPASKGANELTRKIVKSPSSKNWRLNGEIIPGPATDPTRYNDIRPGDLAVMAFNGETSPIEMNLIIISQASTADTHLHTALTALFGNKSMVAVKPAKIAELAIGAYVPETHPIYIAAADPEMDAAIEDAAQGGIEGVRKLLANKGGKKLSGSDFAKAKAEAEQTGQDGEGLVKGYLATQVSTGYLASYTWTSSENPVSPFDFDTLTVSGERTLIDAKATRGAFKNVIHFSLAEIIEASGPVPYRIYRVYELNDDGGKLRISDEIRPLADQLKAIHEKHMPSGIRVDGFSVATSTLNWGEEKYVMWPEEDETV
ncbi:MAG: hypothetical protein HIU81_11665 [Acidobacteria bacterium]|nr:hypothetical protein [Acidobacteriota bacterium]